MPKLAEVDRRGLGLAFDSAIGRRDYRTALDLAERYGATVGDRSAAAAPLQLGVRVNHFDESAGRSYLDEEGPVPEPYFDTTRPWNPAILGLPPVERDNPW